MRNLPRFTLRLLRVLFPLLLFSACGRDSSDDETSDKAPTPRVPVRTGLISRGDVFTSVIATGRTEALRQEKVLSPVAGRVVSLNALEGASFHAGELMAVLRTKESQAIIAGAERLVQLARTPQQRDEARSALALAESSQSTVEIRAKFAGAVASRSVAQGELVAENAELFTLVDLSSLVFIADVPLASMPSVHSGQGAEIRFSAIPRRTFEAVVGSANPQTDLQSQTVKVRFRFRDVTTGTAGVLRTDIMGTARILTGEHRGVLLVPRSALLRNDQDDTYAIVVVTADSLSRTIPVVPGVVSDSLAEVSGGGIAEGESVIVEGNYALADSTRVSPADLKAP